MRKEEAARAVDVKHMDAMYDWNHVLSISRQARVLGIRRGNVYYLPRSTSVPDLALMRRIDELHLDYPFAGISMLQRLLAAEGNNVGRLHVRTLMKKRGIETIYCRRSCVCLLTGFWT